MQFVSMARTNGETDTRGSGAERPMKRRVGSMRRTCQGVEVSISVRSSHVSAREG